MHTTLSTYTYLTFLTTLLFSSQTCQSHERAGLSGEKYLAVLLITPIQRIPRYQLLLVDCLKRTPAWSDDRRLLERAIAGVRDVAEHINETKKVAPSCTALVHTTAYIERVPIQHQRTPTHTTLLNVYQHNTNAFLLTPHCVYQSNSNALLLTPPLPHRKTTGGGALPTTSARCSAASTAPRG